MTDAAVPQKPSPIDLDQLIQKTDALIAEAVRIDPVTAALLGLAKTELLTQQSIQRGEVVRFLRPRPRT